MSGDDRPVQGGSSLTCRSKLSDNKHCAQPVSGNGRLNPTRSLWLALAVLVVGMMTTPDGCQRGVQRERRNPTCAESDGARMRRSACLFPISCRRSVPQPPF
jgi:hypothetical protein